MGTLLGVCMAAPNMYYTLAGKYTQFSWYLPGNMGIFHVSLLEGIVFWFMSVHFQLPIPVGHLLLDSFRSVLSYCFEQKGPPSLNMCWCVNVVWGLLKNIFEHFQF